MPTPYESGALADAPGPTPGPPRTRGPRSDAGQRALFERCEDGILVLGLDGTILSANPACARLHGFQAAEELEHLRLQDLVAVGSRSIAQEWLRRVVSDEAMPAEVEHLHRDGSRIPLRISGSRLQDGETEGLLVFLRDLTEPRRTADPAARQDARLLLALEAAGMVTWELEIATGRLSHSTNLAAMSGAEDVSPYITVDSFTEQLHPDDRARTSEAIQRTMTTGAVFDCEYRVHLVDGSWHWLAGKGRAVADTNGRWTHVLGVSLDVTDRKNAEEALRHSELKHRIVADNTFDWEFWISPEGRFLYSSPSCERITGHPPADFEADPGLMLRLIHPEDRPRYEEHHGTAMQGGHDSEQEFRLLHADGELRWIGHVCCPIRSESGAFLGVRGSNRDITARRRAEDELIRIHRQRERLLLFNEAMMAAIPTPVYYKDWEGRYLGCNPRFTELMGITTEEICGKTAEDLWSPDQALEHDARDLELLRHPGDQRYESTLRDKDGVERPAMFAKSVFQDEDGNPAGIIGAILDISERKRSEEVLAAEAIRRRILIDGSRDGIVVLNPEGRVYEANRRFAEMLGYTAGEVSGLHVWDWDPAWPREQVVAALRDLGPEGAHLETRHRRKDGTYFDVELSNSAAVIAGQKLAFCVCHDITERKRAMDALATREEIFSTIVGQATDSIAVLESATGRFVEFNTSAHEGLGYTREEFTGFAVANIQAEHSPEQIAANIDMVRRLGSASFETKHRHRDGSLRDVRVSLRVLMTRGLDYMTAVWTDITDLKRAEARTRRDRQRTEFLLELHRRAPQMTDQELCDHVLHQALCLTDSSTGVILQVADDQQVLVLTSTNGEAQGRSDAHVGPKSPAADAMPWTACIHDHRAVVGNQPLPPVGTQPELRRHMAVPVSQQGRVRLVLGVGNRDEDYSKDDVAPLQVVANELQKIMTQRGVQHQLRQLSRAVEQSPVSVVITDKRGHIEYTNPRFTEVSGYTLDEVRGRNPRVLQSGEMSADHYRQLWQTVLTGGAWHGEFHNRKKNGELHWESASISPILDPAGRITNLVAVKEDITDRKRLESELRQAQKLEAVGQLAGGVAHDFNNILAAIMMHLGLMQMNPALDSETRDSIKEMEVETGRAASLTRQLLMFSRRSVLAIKPQDLNGIVANLLRMLSRLIGENIKLRFEAGSPLPSVEADAGMLEQVLMNLVVNARDAMPKGGHLAIATSVVNLDGDESTSGSDRRTGHFVCLAVTDTGVGMDAATLKRIFEPFFTTKEAGRGTGLGLATVHGIVAQHKGWVEVTSTPGEGTTFRVILPAMAHEAEPAESLTSTPAPLQRGRETILVVEDESRLRELVGRTLRGLGYRVYEAANGQDAMHLWQRHGGSVDLLLTDMVMPEGMTGLELADRLKATKPDLRVIVTSGYSSEIVQAGLPTKAGITYLPKPFPDRSLADIVRTCLDGRR